MKGRPRPTPDSNGSGRAEVKLREKHWRKFELFNDCKDPALIKALNAAKQFVTDMASRHVEAYWLTLTGPSGTGKTLLAKIINTIFQLNFDLYADERAETNEILLRKGGMKHWPTAVEQMRDGDFTGVAQLKSDWFSVLDDIGAEHKSASDFGTSKLYDVLNARIGLWTVITVNMDIEAIASMMDTRIASRLLRNESVVCNIKTADYNQRPAEVRTSFRTKLDKSFRQK